MKRLIPSWQWFGGSQNKKIDAGAQKCCHICWFRYDPRLFRCRKAIKSYNN